MQNNDSEILSKYINEILKGDFVLGEMSKRSLDKIKNYTIEKMAQEHIEIFQNVFGYKYFN